MRKQQRIWLAALSIIFIGGMAWWIVADRIAEPVYNGHPLRYWLDGIVFTQGEFKDLPTPREANGALLQIDTNAIPTLMRMAEAHDSPLKLKFFALAEKQHFINTRFKPAAMLNFEAEIGFQFLDSDAKYAVPELIRIYDRKVSLSSQRIVSDVLCNLGPEAKAAAPSLLRGISSSDDLVRFGAIKALGRIRTDPDTVIPALIKSLRDPSDLNRMDAAYALGAYGRNAKAAIGPLVEMLKEPVNNSNSMPFSAGLHYAVEVALGQINP